MSPQKPSVEGRKAQDERPVAMVDESETGSVCLHTKRSTPSPRLPSLSNKRIISDMARFFAASLLVALLAVPASASTATALPDPCSLLTNAQVAPTVDGKVQLRNATRDRFSRTCTWSGPPMGYMQMSESLILQLDRVSRSTFISEQLHSIPQPTEIQSTGILAFLSTAGLSVWKDGLAIEMDSPYVTVYPETAVALAKDALRRV